jgi:hypothetical protein
MVGDFTRRMMEVADGKMPVWMILQIAFSGVVKPGKTLRFPTFPEERFMAYQAIINGARGLIFFGGHLPQAMTPEDAALGWNWRFWNRVLRPVIEEIGEKSPLAPALVALRMDGTFRFRASLPIIWAVAWLLISSVFAAKEERYFFFAIPAIGLLAGAGMVELGRRQTGKPLFLLLTALVVFVMVVVVGTPAAHLPDMKPTVSRLAQQSDADLVLVDSVRDGQFVFDVRTDPAANGRIVPLRASKLLYSRAARTRYDYQQHVNSPADIVGLLDSLGIRYVVLEDRLPTTSQPDEDRSWDTLPRLMLRELLADAHRFERLFSQSMKCNDPAWANVNLVTYRYKNAPPRRTDTITIPFPAMGKSLQLRLRQEKDKSLPTDNTDEHR